MKTKSRLTALILGVIMLLSLGGNVFASEDAELPAQAAAEAAGEAADTAAPEAQAAEAPQQEQPAAEEPAAEEQEEPAAEEAEGPAAEEQEQPAAEETAAEEQEEPAEEEPASEEPSAEMQADASSEMAGAAEIGDTQYASLKEAIDSAADGDTVVLLKNITALADLTGGTAGTITVSGKSITLDGAGYEIDRTDEYLGTVFTVESGAALTVKDLTIEGLTEWSWSYDFKTTSGYGYDLFYVTVADRTYVGTGSFIKNAGTLTLSGVTAHNLYSAQVCGALVNSTGSLTISDCEFSRIFAEMKGAPYYIGGVIHAENCTVDISGTAADNCGTGYQGQFHAGGFASFNHVGLKIDNSSFSSIFSIGNSGVMDMRNMYYVTVSSTSFDACVNGNDGGMTQLEYNDASVTPTDFSFTDCSWSNMVGTALYNQSIGNVIFVRSYPGYDAAPITFTSCTFYNGLNCDGVYADAGDGSEATIICSDCTFTDNQSGVFLLRVGQLTLNNCTFTGNKHNNGAITVIQAMGEPSVAFYNTEVTGNTATGRGGAVFAYEAEEGAKSTITIGEGSTFTGNTAGTYGGAISVACLNNPVADTLTTITVENGAKLYNNTAGTAGDDIAVTASAVAETVLSLPNAEGMSVNTPDGLFINGWYHDNLDDRFVRYVSDEYTDAVEASAELSERLYLKAEVGGYTIVFDKDADDAVGTMEPMQMEFDEEESLTKNTFTRAGFIFTGWNTEPDGNGTSYTDTETVKDLTDTNGGTVTLYAQWTPIPVGSLTVTNTVAGNAGDKTKEFSFTVTLDDTTVNGTYGEMTFKDGVASFTLKDGESITAEGLYEKTAYTVTETDYTADGYVTTKTGETGAIVGDGTVTAAFTNTKNTEKSSTPSANPGSKSSTSPKTGDSAHPGAWAGLFAASLLGLAAAVIVPAVRRRGFRGNR